jgi:RNA polymerase sigma factor (sigma-70 family)
MIPYNTTYKEDEDKALIPTALAGSRAALSALVERHQQFIYNVALKLVRDTEDAADLTQEVLLKMVTRLGQYKGKSSFRTWLYRMVVNHFLNSKRSRAEAAFTSFDAYGGYLDTMYNAEDMTDGDQRQYSNEIESVRNKCMASTLLCLDRQQRIVLILGSIFNLKSADAAAILDITPENFRKQLSRAKADLFQFMDNKCDLINPANPCRCHKKTAGFIKAGLVSPATGQFHQAVQQSIQSALDTKNQELDYLMEERYLRLFTSQPYEDQSDKSVVFNHILADPLVQKVFQLN